MNPGLRRVLTLTITTLVVLIVPACGDDEGDSASAEEYCEIKTELDAAGEKAFSDLKEDATEDEYDAVQEEFVKANRDRFEDLVDVAPGAIKDDLRIVVDGVLDPNAPENEEAADRVSEFDAETCD